MTTTVEQGKRRFTSHLIEQRSIDYVPPTERHGKVRDQFTVWSAANATALNIFFGSLAILLGLIATHLARCQKRGIRLVVAGASPRVRQVFHITKMDSVIPLASTIDEAEIL